MPNSQPSNYEIMRDRTELEFVKYDQEKMIQKFGLKHTNNHLFINFVGREYRINRKTGRVEWYSPLQRAYVHADYNESMTIFDMLAWSKPGCRLDGQFVPSGELKGTTKSACPSSDLFAPKADLFAGRCQALQDACKKLGGRPGPTGDVSSILPLFDFFPVMVQFWDADEEFNAVLKFMWDKNATDFIHFETIAFATMHLITRLQEIMDENN